jgi:hypothetical protein
MVWWVNRMTKFQTHDIDDEDNAVEVRAARLIERLKLERPDIEKLQPAECKIVLNVEHLLLLIDETQGEDEAETAFNKIEFFRSLTHYIRGVSDAIYIFGSTDLPVYQYLKIIRSCASQLLIAPESK